MKVLQVIYNIDTNFILDIVSNFNNYLLIETYNIDQYKDKKKALPIMTRFGTTKVPLLVFKDENLKEYSAIWSEQNPDWKIEIKKKLE